MKHLLLPFLLLLFGYSVSAQNYANQEFYLIDSLDLDVLAASEKVKLDSCLTIFHSEQHDTVRAAALSFFIEECWDEHVWPKYNIWLFDYIENLLTEQPQIFQTKNKLNSLWALSINNIGFQLKKTGDNSRALEFYLQSFQIYNEIGDKEGIAQTLNNLARIYEDQGDIARATEHYLRNLEILEQVGNNTGIALTLNNLAFIYKGQGDISKALEHHLRCLEIYEQSDNKKGIANTLNNLTFIYHDQGDIAKALKHNLRSLEIYKQLGNKKGIATELNGLALIYKDQGDTAKALEHHLRSLEINEEIGSKKGVALSLNNIGRIHLEQGNPKKARQLGERSLDIAKSLGYPKRILAASMLLSEAYADLGDHEQALSMHLLYTEMRDSLNNEDLKRKLTEQKYQEVYEKQAMADSLSNVEKAHLVKEAHQEEVRKKNKTRNVLIGSGLFLILIAGGIYSRLRYTRKAKEEIEKEKDRSENLLLNILPADIAAELKEKGRADARDFEKVSILFTDFKGFTSASEKLSAQELVAEINTCFEAFDGIMGQYNIEKIKTIGDAYMAAGGLPVPTNDSVKNTVLAALEMQDFIRDRKTKLDAEGKPGFEMRVGVHTGPVVAGIVGVKKFQYDIWGDTVNTASRMESSGDVGKVNISEATYELLKDGAQFAFESRGKIEAKGKGEMEMYFVSQKG